MKVKWWMFWKPESGGSGALIAGALMFLILYGVIELWRY